MANGASDEVSGCAVEAAVRELLEATLALVETLSMDPGTGGKEPAPEELAAAFRVREQRFERLRALPRPPDWVATAATRACLERVRELDASMLAFGEASAVALRGERHGLQRRRQAIHSQLARDRAEPRLLTLKA